MFTKLTKLTKQFTALTPLLMTLVFLVLATSAEASKHRGNLVGSVVHSNDCSLPGTPVVATNGDKTFERTTDADGKFSFFRIPAGSYVVTADLDEVHEPEVVVIEVPPGATASTEIRIGRHISDLVSCDLALGQIILREINPNALDETVVERSVNDLWAIVSKSPDILSDRVDVGGSESGQQATLVRLGTSSRDNVFTLDGVTTSDLTAIGSSLLYYDVDALEEIEVTSGGASVTQATAGATINLITRKGTNSWRGSGRYALSNDSLQSDPDLDQSDFPNSQDPTVFEPNQVDQIEALSAEAGGPIVDNRVWIWAAYGDQQIGHLQAGGVLDQTTLRTGSLKVNFDASSANSGVALWTRGDKLKSGRDGGPSRTFETTWNQDGPTDVLKLEDTHLFTSNFYLTGLYGTVDGGFTLAPEGGLAVDAVQDSNGIWRGSFQFNDFDRDSRQAKLASTSFFNTGSVSHELDVGFESRQFDTRIHSFWPGRGLINIEGENFGIGGQTEVLIATRGGDVRAETDYDSAWIQDTLRIGDLGASLGLRYDAQEGRNLESELPGNEIIPHFLPTVRFAGNDPGFDWQSVSPRLGLSYALGKDLGTVVRASYARFAEQLGTDYITLVNPATPSSVYYFYTDSNDNNRFDDGEDLSSPFSFVNVNPFDLSIARTSIEPGFDPPRTDEITIGIERTVTPTLTATATATVRQVNDLVERRLLVFDQNGTVREATAADYRLDGTLAGTLPDGSNYDVPYFTLKPGLASTGASRLVNGDRSQEYLGLNLGFARRLEGRWSTRGHIAWHDWTWVVPASSQRTDDPTDTLGSQDNPGAPVAEQSLASASRSDVWLNSRWTANLFGLYQVAPEKVWGFDVAGNISAREGFVNPLYRPIFPSNSPRVDVAVSEVDQFRHDDLVTVDLNLQKTFVFGGFDLGLSLEGFNLLNESVVLQRQGNQALSTANYVRETVSPRLFRVGVKLLFR